MPHVNKKPRTGKQSFFQTIFSLYFKILVNKFHAAKLLAFWLHFLFGRDHKHYNFTSKVMKMCEQILKTAEELGNRLEESSSWRNYLSNQLVPTKVTTKIEK